MKAGWVAAAVVVGCVAAAACGSSNKSGGGGTGGPQIVISNLTYSPADLTVDAGTTITLINQDGMEHSVVSEASDNSFTQAAVGGVSFMVDIPAATGTSGGPYGGGGSSNPGTATLTIPANAPSGTVIPFYCHFHTNTMKTPNGHLTIR